MRSGDLVRLSTIIAAMAVLAALWTGCGGSPAAPTSQPEGTDNEHVSANLDTSYENALSVSGQLALGMLQLEGTDDAVTPDQASKMLPLWQALSAGSLQSEVETTAVLHQIESGMTADQLASIAALRLTFESLQTWAQEQGFGFPAGEGAVGPGEGGPFGDPNARATRQAEGGRQGPGAAPGMDPEAVATMRAQMENMTDEQREALRATAQAGGGFGSMGGFRGQGGFAGALGQVRFVYRPLIDLLTARATE